MRRIRVTKRLRGAGSAGTGAPAGRALPVRCVAVAQQAISREGVSHGMVFSAGRPIPDLGASQAALLGAAAAVVTSGDLVDAPCPDVLSYRRFEDDGVDERHAELTPGCWTPCVGTRFRS